MASIFQRGRIPFVGRRAELERLAQHRARLEGNHDRGRHVGLIEGFSGVGKTALVEKFLSMLDRDSRSFTPHGAYSAHLRRPPLAPFLDALDELLTGRFAQRRIRSLFADSTYYPLLARLPMLSSSIEFDSDGIAAGALDLDTLAALIASVLTHLSRSRPVVVMLDDIQYMPEEDLRALTTLNDNLRNAPVLILATMNREVPGAAKIREVLQPALLDHFYMPPLSVQEVAELLSELYGALASAQLSNDLAKASEGVPRRVIELIRRLEEAGVLTQDAKGGWILSQSYHPRLLAAESTSVERLSRLDGDERLALLLLACAGGQAGRGELVEWAETIARANGETNGEESPGRNIFAALDRLVETLLIKPVFSNPDQVTFAHNGILEAERQIRTADELRAIAQMIVSRRELRLSAYRWTYDPDLFDVLLESLPPAETEERRELMEPLIGSTSSYTNSGDNEHRMQVYRKILGGREHLTSREYARMLIKAIDRAHVNARFPEALTWAEDLYEMTASDPDCFDLRAEACVFLAASRFYRDHTADVSALLQEGWRALGTIEDPRTRMTAELEVTKTRASLIPVGEPREAVRQGRRVIFLAEQLGLEDEKYSVLPDLMIRSARLRYEEDLRFFCNELLNSIQNQARPLPPFTAVSNGVRAALIYGDIFLARAIFENWRMRSAPLAITDFVAYTYLTALFAFTDGEPLLAAEIALSTREEVLRYRAASKQFPWELAYNYTMLQVQVVPFMLVAGRYAEALGLAETMLVEVELNNPSTFVDVDVALSLYRMWLRWRCLLPVDAPVSLCWPTVLSPLEGGNDRLNRAFDPAVARPAGDAFRNYYAKVIDTASLPPRFVAEILLAALECAEKDYPAALAAVERAAAACEQLYDWNKEVEYRASAITVKLRWAESEPDRAQELIDAVLEETRELLAKMAEKGLASRISQLVAMFKDDAALLTGTSHRDLVGQFERLGATTHASANTVIRNSRSQESGPIEQARLFMMGPLRLMRPYSYLELGESAFGREGARMLLTALVAAEVLERVPTREELAAQVAPKAKTQEQQKKALYNAASAVRTACASPNSILAIGASNVELNTNPELEGSVWVDALEIMRSARVAKDLEHRGETGAAFDRYQHVLQLARKGDFAADIYAEWVDAARDRLREVVRDAALATARISLRTGLYPIGIDAMSTQLTRDPFDEEAHRYLIRLYNESGNRSAALKQIEKCRKLILREFGVELEPETLRLRQEIMEMSESVGG